jgi:CBS domain-containing protein
MLVKDLMTEKVVTVRPFTLISEVADIMHKNGFTGLPVVNDDNVVMGVISEQDFITGKTDIYLPTYIKLLANMDYVQGAQKELPHVVDQIVKATARDVMNQEVPYVRPDTTLEQVAELFASKDINPIPVTDNSNHLLGIISRGDLIKFYSPSHIQASYIAENRPPRMIDQEVEFTQEHFSSTFAYVAKARANIWLTATVILFIIGFVVGIIYVADPNIFVKQTTEQR